MRYILDELSREEHWVGRSDKLNSNSNVREDQAECVGPLSSNFVRNVANSQGCYACSEKF
jgi:hypothetical protein